MAEACSCSLWGMRQAGAAGGTWFSTLDRGKQASRPQFFQPEEICFSSLALLLIVAKSLSLLTLASKH